VASEETTSRILEAARSCLLADGYSAMTTRRVAEGAGVPLSQIHYHFGSKDEMILSLLRAENDRLVERQAEMFARDLPLWERWDLACDYLDQDLDSGYVRVLLEMTAAGWSTEAVGEEVRVMFDAWNHVLVGVAQSAEADGFNLGAFSAGEVAALTGAAFIGSEALILLGLESEQLPYRRGLRQIGQLIKEFEKGTT